MKTSFANSPRPEQILGTIRGFTFELCKHPGSLNTAYRLRHKAYFPDVHATPGEDLLMKDHFDELPFSNTHLIWFEGKPVATVRNMIYSSMHNWAQPEICNYFGKKINEKLGKEYPFLESSKFAVDPGFGGRNSLFAKILLFHIQALASFAYKCEYFLTAVRENHIRFYHRFLALEPLCPEPQYYPKTDDFIHALFAEQLTCINTGIKHGVPPITQEAIDNYRRCAGLSDSLKKLAG